MRLHSKKIGIDHDSASSTIIYNKVVEKIEHFSKKTHFILMKVTLASFMVPPTIVAYYKYYVLELNEASFQNDTLMYGILVAFSNV